MAQKAKAHRETPGDTLKRSGMNIRDMLTSVVVHKKKTSLKIIILETTKVSNWGKIEWDKTDQYGCKLQQRIFEAT